MLCFSGISAVRNAVAVGLTCGIVRRIVWIITGIGLCYGSFVVMILSSCSTIDYCANYS